MVLLHGIWDTGSIFSEMAGFLRHLGWKVYDLDLEPNNGDAPLELLARQTANFVNRTFSPNTTIDLVGFSMGGIVGRYYVQRLGGIDRVQRFVTLSSPHRGTWLAYSSFRLGCTQMRPDSPFLQDLNRDAAMLRRIQFTSVWTPLDAMIVPANSSQLSIGDEVCVWVPTHAQMVTDARSIQAVAMALATPFKPPVAQSHHSMAFSNGVPQNPDSIAC